MKFKVGDVVRSTFSSATFGILRGERGVIACVDPHHKFYGVNWDSFNENRRTCDGSCQEGHGLWVDKGGIELDRGNDAEDVTRTQDISLFFDVMRGG